MWSIDYVQVPKDCPLSGDSMIDEPPPTPRPLAYPLIKSKSKSVVEETKPSVLRRLGKQMHVSSLSTDYPNDDRGIHISLLVIIHFVSKLFNCQYAICH